MKQRAKYPIRGERLKIILDETGITQGKLSRLTGIAQQNLSAAIKGSVNLSETSARAIIEEVPQYRFEWLFGLDNFKTQSEFNLGVLGNILEEGNALNAAVCTLAQLCGYSVSRWEDRLASNISAEQAVSEIKNGYEYSSKKTVLSLTLEEQTALENEILDFVRFKLSRANPTR